MNFNNYKSHLIFLASLILIAFLYQSCKKDNPKIKENPINIKAAFVADKTILAQGDLVNFTDSTSGFPLTWKWTFEGGIPSTSTIQHPKNIKYNDLGTYNVTLVVTNAHGKDSIVKKGYIQVTTAVNLPSVITAFPYDITISSAVGGGEVTDIGTAPLIEAGICWSTNTNPTTNDFKLSVPMTDIGDFSFVMNDLVDNTKYYYRAYARSEVGIKYGSQYTFNTIEIDTCDHIIERFTDPRNGKSYRYTEIGGKIWMGDNLDYPTNESWCYNDNPAKCDQLGRLYTIESAKNACPDGWRLPTIEDWDNMILAVGSQPGEVLKAKNLWNPSSASNLVCFSAKPAGYKNLESNTYSTENYFGYWWTASKNDENLNISKHISYDNSSVQTIPYDNKIAFSVRCIKN